MGDVTLDGLGIVAQIYAEQNQLKTSPNPAKFVDQSYLRAALKEIDGR